MAVIGFHLTLESTPQRREIRPHQGLVEEVTRAVEALVVVEAHRSVCDRVRDVNTSD